MMSPQKRMPTVADKIRSWCADNLAHWEKAALQKIMASEVLLENDYEELLQHAMQESGLAGLPSDTPKRSPALEVFTKTKTQHCRLERLSNLKHVNALPDSQEILFDPQITLIFGANAAGKTGYARLLGCSAFGRGQREVLSNVFDTSGSHAPQADIEIFRGGRKETITWKMGKPTPELSGFYVFDGASLNAHLNLPKALNFSPSGLGLLSRLAEVTDEVRKRLQAIVAQRNTPNNLNIFFSGESAISERIKALSAGTDLIGLKKMGCLTSEDREKITHLERQIGELKSEDPSRRIAGQRAEITDLTNLLEAIQNAAKALDESAAPAVEQLTRALKDCLSEVTSSSAEQFKSETFTQIGTPAWHQFIAAAKALGEAEASSRVPYPTHDDRCLLCHQPLTTDAVALIKRLWNFLASHAQERKQRAQQACKEKILQLQALNLHYFASNSTVRRLLEHELPTIVPMIESQLEAWLARREEMCASLQDGELRKVPPQINIPLLDIRKLIEARVDEIARLEKSDAKERLVDLEKSLLALSHRQALDEHFAEIEEYVHMQEWLARARSALGTTRHITLKHNELFDELVTGRYIKTFQAMLARFKSNMNVKIETYGQKGERIRQIVLGRANTPTRYFPEQVLSDGEKRAVALADFLTEVIIDESSCGIILDDPVIALDNDWKIVLAGCLVEQSMTRQVIVFTHDLPFLYHLNERAKQLSRTVTTHWIRQEAEQPGFVYLGNSPVCEKDFKSAKLAQKYYAEAKNAAPAKQQSILQQGFGALRSSYEALVMFDLFNGVVERFEERIRADCLKDVQVPASISAEIANRMAALSRHIDAHLHSDALSKQPSTADLLKELELFEKLRAKIRELRKPVSVPATTLQSVPTGGAPAKSSEAEASLEDTPKRPGTHIN